MSWTASTDGSVAEYKVNYDTDGTSPFSVAIADLDSDNVSVLLGKSPPAGATEEHGGRQSKRWNFSTERRACLRM